MKTAIFSFLKSRFESGKQTQESLKRFVVSGRITKEEYKEITGVEYRGE